ncbi:hypothetical protein PSHT_07070 [Puccinia striiformis]|uniref:Uncharacterized protein n=1 Tax=Puccinia striiformis TaxID=27350 RepID=A0A2S4W0W2_9BASI|nr:hypothetical protein PSHT_07070 [Puccinia striiformis]
MWLCASRIDGLGYVCVGCHSCESQPDDDQLDRWWIGFPAEGDVERAMISFPAQRVTDRPGGWIVDWIPDWSPGGVCGYPDSNKKAKVETTTTITTKERMTFKLFNTTGRIRTRKPKTAEQEPQEQPTTLEVPKPSSISGSSQHHRRISFRNLFTRTSSELTTATTTTTTDNDSQSIEVLNSPTQPSKPGNERSVSEPLQPPPSLSIITSTQPQKLRKKASLISLVDSFKSPNNPSPSTHSIRSPSFALKSFRNTRTPINNNSTNNNESEPANQPLHPLERNSALPASIASISRPSSPSSKISAAAFREARAARNSRASISSAFSDLHSPLSANLPVFEPSSTLYNNKLPPPTKHARFKPSPSKAMSDYGHPPSAKPKGYRSAEHQNYLRQQQRMTQSLISQIPDRYSVSPTKTQQPLPNGLSNATTNLNNGLYSEHDILTPPRPAFYGSRMSARSKSTDQTNTLPSSRSSFHSNQIHNGPGNTLYTNQQANHSSSSIRSVPSVPVVRVHPSNQHHHQSQYNNNRQRSSTTTVKAPNFHHDAPRLDQWHSDDEDQPGESTAVIRNKTITPSGNPRTRQQLHINSNSNSIFLPFLNSPNSPNSSLLINTNNEDLNNNRRASSSSSSVTAFSGKASSIVNGDNNSHRVSRFMNTNQVIPPLPQIRADLMNNNNGLKAISNYHQHPRGNSPASSSSGGSGTGSGSGTWSIPITPRDSMVTVHSLNLPILPISLQSNPLVRPTSHITPSFNSSAYCDQFSLLQNPTLPQIAPDITLSSGNLHPSYASFIFSSLPPSLSLSVSIKNDHSLGSSSTDENQMSSAKEGGREVTTGGYWTGVRVEELGVPAGVDETLYAGLGDEQKIQLHQRSQMIMQMMAAQAQAAAQMHAHALALASPSSEIGNRIGPDSISRDKPTPTEKKYVELEKKKRDGGKSDESLN